MSTTLIQQATWPAIGIHPGIAPEIYFAEHDGPLAERIVSKSMLWKFSKNPRRWRDSPPLVPTAAMKWGSLIDCLSLTPDRYQGSYRMKPETYLAPESAKKDAPMIEKPWNANSNTCKQWLADLPSSVECISEFDFREACKARDALFARKEFREMMNGAQTQVGMRINLDDRVHGFDGISVPFKGLLDIVPAREGPWGNALVDLKMFARLDSMDDVEREIYNRGYDFQACAYLDCWNALTGENRNEFFFAFQLSELPYEVAIVQLSDDALLSGRKRYRDSIRKWAKVVTTGEFESPWDGIQIANLPRWAQKREDLT